MHEAPEIKPPDLQSFTTAQILRESWEICTEHLGALIIPFILIHLPMIAMSFIMEHKAFNRIYHTYNYLVVPVVVIGIHRAVLNLKD